MMQFSFGYLLQLPVMTRIHTTFLFQTSSKLQVYIQAIMITQRIQRVKWENILSAIFISFVDIIRIKS